MKTLDAKRVLEAALICSSQPGALREMSALFAGEVGNDTLRELLEELADECKGRAIELVSVATGWRYQSRAELAPYLARLDPERPPKYSRAVLETLAIIAYRQPATRAEVEAVRGVLVGPVLRLLQEKRLIKVTGRAEVVGRALQYGTTRRFLDHFGLASIEELPKVFPSGRAAAPPVEVPAGEPADAPAAAPPDGERDAGPADPAAGAATNGTVGTNGHEAAATETAPPEASALAASA
jgi:segregation and condensation protein B